MSSTTKVLIINADDFGYCPRRNAAIVDLFRRQAISSTSLLINGDYASEAHKLATLHHIPIGLHLNLTEGRPITTDLNRISSLVDAYGMMHGKMGLRNAIDQGSIDMTHVEYEIEMQFRQYRQWTTNEQYPMHIDGHQHIHIHPMLAECIARQASRFNVKYIRVPFDQAILTKSNPEPFYQTVIEQACNARTIFNRYGLCYPSYFIGLTTMGQAMTYDNLERRLKMFTLDTTSNIAELMCHPGYPSVTSIGGCGTGQPDEFSCSFDRQHEFDLLFSEEFRQLLTKYNIHLGTYADVDQCYI
ncbi:unnamed protein product [Adineta steineri]|uniref:Carbohydrate deacetylase n=1 Tax=Adineta steineri TaxID=433720 RepID=A0A819M3W2_9BILA|nr:unnamed protein product [Adineta steineri]